MAKGPLNREGEIVYLLANSGRQIAARSRFTCYLKLKEADLPKKLIREVIAFKGKNILLRLVIF